MENIEFAFRKEQSGLFGSILRPVARVILINGHNRVPEILYVDSGADIFHLFDITFAKNKKTIFV